uniref:DDE-1 domain-containing protein n=1 Tax=Heterorhabditis bacteriophora TaxID=37862 RepID=A0A1I7X468_HETBA
MNPMESLRTILLCPIYAGNRQLETAKDLQFSISKEWSEVDESVIKNLVNSMPERIFQKWALVFNILQYLEALY